MAGTFLFATVPAGTYTLHAEESGRRSAVIDSLEVSAGAKKHIDLILETPDPSVASRTSNSSPSTMELADKPSFTVAGVADWNNVGLHGSDTTSRTSDALAKETLALKSDKSSASTGTSDPDYQAARAYKAKGDFPQAREHVLKMLRRTDTADAHRLLADIEESLGDPLSSVREYEKAARMDPREENYFEWGAELLLHKAPTPAVEVFTKGSNAHPKSARMLAGLGAALYASGSFDDAAQRICAASDLNPADPAPYLFLGEMVKAVSAPLPCSEQALARYAETHPENALASYYYALSLWKRERGSANPANSQQTEVLLQKAIAIEPQLAEAHVQLGVLYSEKGRTDQSIVAFKKAIEANPQLAEAHYRLSLAYKRGGDESKANQEFDAYQQIEKKEAATVERQRRELRQFLIILKDQRAATSPR